jgi:hypothetical protein
MGYGLVVLNNPLPLAERVCLIVRICYESVWQGKLDGLLDCKKAEEFFVMETVAARTRMMEMERTA